MNTYKTPFGDDWSRNAWIKIPEPERYTFDPALKYYSVDLAPLLAHPSVDRAPDSVKDELLILYLHVYLEFTVWLEMNPVNSVSNLIRQPGFLPWLPAEMKDDAYLVCIDESGHAEKSRRLSVAVAAATGVERLELMPQFLALLQRLHDHTEPEVHSFVDLFFVIISETLITGSLSQLPRDESVQRGVREVARNHARDESRHHRYFRSLFETLWPRMPRPLQVRLGRMLPAMITAFLRPDEHALVAMLRRYPQHFPSPAQTVRELCESDQVVTSIRDAAGPSLNMLRDNGLLDTPEIRRAFEESSLLA